jgi:hypothetical protein
MSNFVSVCCQSSPNQLRHEIKERVRQMWLLPGFYARSRTPLPKIRDVGCSGTPFRLSQFNPFARIVLLGYEIIYDTSTVLFLAFQRRLSGVRANFSKFFVVFKFFFKFLSFYLYILSIEMFLVKKCGFICLFSCPDL